ncbi:HPF/RaiA family ribosome-associated protein [Ostreiculturibacter nitratireducens]|uniref:HPF/RaiA family ribosome-associated protein n=1 Tax=Ostreiculturibacter nitratireducens TaxID=3075226 RepID=UPI0031B57DDB
METEPQITFRGLDHSDAAEGIIREKIDKLERFHDRITSCRVTVEKTTRQGHKGHLFYVALDIEVPGGSVHVSGKPGDQNAHEDLNVAIRDSFNAAQRQLQDHVRKSGPVHVKSHPEKHHGQVVRLFPDEGYGFIKTPGGLEVYFQRDSVVREDWERIDYLSEVEFSLMDGEKGPFAVNVSMRA